MGAAGLTSSSIEMASKGNVGLEIDLTKVPMRASNMTAYELMLSESQERMLMVLEPGKEDMARNIFKKWDLEFEVIGRVTDTKNLVLNMHGKEEACIPINILVEDAPEYQREYTVRDPAAEYHLDKAILNNKTIIDDLVKMIGHPNLCSRRWIWEQYDHMGMADTLVRPGSDAAVVRVHGTNKAIAISTDCSPTYCKHNSFEGGKHAVVETWRNLIASGAEPIAITDCMNFGNPEKPEIMGEFVECIRGMTEACSVLSYPVVSGNVSLYNETNGEGIYPTPAIGGVGLIKDINKIKTLAFKELNSKIYTIGKNEGHIGNTQFLSIILNKEIGSTPTIDLSEELKNGRFILELVNQDLILSSHDIGEGGLLVAVAEMAMSGEIGASININDHTHFFSEDQSRYLIEVSPNNEDKINQIALDSNIAIELIGETTKDDLIIEDIGQISVQNLKLKSESWFPNFTK